MNLRFAKQVDYDIVISDDVAFCDIADDQEKEPGWKRAVGGRVW